MQSPYDYVFDEITNAYCFITKNNILYRIFFAENNTLSEISKEDIPNVYLLTVEKSSKGIEPLDIQVSKTVENIIEKFFEQPFKMLLYVCDDGDGRANSRHKKFEGWYQKSKLRDRITKIDSLVSMDLNNEDIPKLYTSFLIHKQNGAYDKMIQIFARFEAALHEEK